MILSPDFFHHWKTVTLQAEHGTEGVLALIRLWAHCYERRAETFRATPDILKAITGLNGKVDAFEGTLTALRLIERRRKYHHARLEGCPQKAVFFVSKRTVWRPPKTERKTGRKRASGKAEKGQESGQEFQTLNRVK